MRRVLNSVVITSSVRRPWSVWLVGVIGIVLGPLFVLFLAPWFMFPPRHAFLPPDFQAWVFLVCVILYIAACYGVLRGAKTARVLLTYMSAAFVIFFVIGSIEGYYRFGEILPEHDYWDDYFWTEAFWLDLLRTGSFPLYLIVTTALLRNKRNEAFFNARSDDGPARAIRGMALALVLVPGVIFGGIYTVYRLTGNPSHPPPIFSDLLATSPGRDNGEEWERETFGFARNDDGPRILDEKSRELTDRLRNVVGTEPARRYLITLLDEEGFWPAHAEEVSCFQLTSDGEREPCPVEFDPENTMDFVLWRFDGYLRDQCMEQIRVTWSRDGARAINPEAEYMKVCEFMFEPWHWPWWV